MGSMNIAAVDKFKGFEWLMQGITAKSINYEPSVHGTGEKPLTYEDRLGAIASMDTQLAKSITALIIFNGKSESDYEFVRNHLAKIMMKEAEIDKRREPEHIAMYQLSWLIARMVLDFALDPNEEDNYTAKGRLAYAGIKSYQMDVDKYRMTWKRYEKLMVLAIESAIDEASNAVQLYKKNTYKEMIA